MSINEIQNNIISDFSFLETWEEKYEYIISLGKNLELMPEKGKNDKYLIKGCQSNVWVFPEMKDSKLFFYADSDAIITKGIISLILSVVSGHSPKEISQAELYFIEKTDIKKILSPTRANGLLSMLKQIKLYSIAFMMRG